MYRKVVVPLDGSKLAEVSLAQLDRFKGPDAPEILLVSVTEPLPGRVSRQAAAPELPPREYHPPRPSGPMAVGSSHTGTIFTPDPTHPADVPVGMGRMAATASDYLVKVAGGLRKKGLIATPYVLVGSPAEQIIDFAEDQHADLIVMASRGRSGLNRWDIGNVADRVRRASNVPVLLVKPEPGFTETKRKRRGRPN